MNHNERNERFNVHNNRGEGFDPTAEIDGWTCLHEASTTDDVSVYEDETGATILVGTDGSGADDTRWAVRVAG